MKKTFAILIGILLATNVYAQTSYVPNLLPITTDKFDLGTTTPDKRWFHLFTKYASTTALTVSGLTSKDCVGTDSTGLLITGTCTGGSAGTPNLIQSLYSGTNYYTASTTDTTNLSWYFRNGFLSTASSTLTSSLTLSSLSNGGLGVNNGLVYSGATTTFSGGLTYASGNVTNTLTAGDGLTRTVDDFDCDTASGTVFGCLSSANWTTFNNKQDTITAGDNLTLTGTDIDLDTTLTSMVAGTFSGLITAGNFLANASSTLQNFTGVNATTTNATTTAFSTGTLTVTGTATTTFAGAIDTDGNHITTHGIRGDATDGIMFHANNWGLVATMGAGNSLNSIFYGGVNVTGNLAVLTGSTLTVTDITSALTLTGAGGVFAEYAGTSCTNQFPRSLSALGVATCASINNDDWSGADLTVANGGTGLSTFGGTNTILYTTSADTLSSEAGFTYNPTTDLFTVVSATTTQLSVASQTFYIDGNGRIQGKDTTNAWSGVMSPTRSFVLGSATTTTWTASTTGSAYSPYLVMPFTGTLRQFRCATDASFLGVNVQVNGSNVTPSYVIASTTVGKISVTAGNTFTVGQKVLANFGTTTTASALSINCTFDVTETY